MTKLRLLVLAAAAALSVASLAAKYSYRPLASVQPKPRGSGCLYDVLFQRPAPGTYTEIGLFEVANAVNNAIRTEQQVRDLLGKDVCEKGADGVYVEKDPQGNVFRATALLYAQQPIRRAPDAARCEAAGRYALTVQSRLGNCSPTVAVTAVTVVLSPGAPGAAPSVTELSVAPYGPLSNGYVSSWDPTGCQISVKGSQSSTVLAPFEAAFSLLLKPALGDASGEGSLTFSGGQREGQPAISACAETFQLRGQFSR